MGRLLTIGFSVIVSLFILTSCGSDEVESKSDVSNNSDSKDEIERDIHESENEKEEIEEDEEEDIEKDEPLTEKKLEDLIESQPLKVIKTDYLVQDEQHNTLYPDMLQAVIENNSGEDIRNAVIAFVAWDENELPLKLEGSIDFSDGSYIKMVSYDDINLIDGETFGEESGFELDSNNDIQDFKAIVYSYETFEGEEWENEYLDDFSELYENERKP